MREDIRLLCYRKKDFIIHSTATPISISPFVSIAHDTQVSQRQSGELQVNAWQWVMLQEKSPELIESESSAVGRTHAVFGSRVIFGSKFVYHLLQKKRQSHILRCFLCKHS